MKKLKLITGAAGLAVLAACGGSGGSSVDSVADEVLDDGSFDNLAAEFDALSEVESRATAFGDLPTNATANYNGVVAMIFNPAPGRREATVADSDLLGEATLTATFDTVGGTVSGSLDNFVDRDDEAVSGMVTLADAGIGELNGNAVFAGAANGTFSSNGQSAALKDSGYVGVFADNANSVAGYVLGNVTGHDEITTVLGGFVAD